MRLKRPRREDDHSPSSSAEVKNALSYTSTNPYVFMALLFFLCSNVPKT